MKFAHLVRTARVFEVERRIIAQNDPLDEAVHPRTFFWSKFFALRIIFALRKFFALRIIFALRKMCALRKSFALRKIFALKNSFTLAKFLVWSHQTQEMHM